MSPNGRKGSTGRCVTEPNWLGASFSIIIVGTFSVDGGASTRVCHERRAVMRMAAIPRPHFHRDGPVSSKGFWTVVSAVAMDVDGVSFTDIGKICVRFVRGNIAVWKALAN